MKDTRARRERDHSVSSSSAAGCTYGPDGQLLIGGLSIDGSAAGEAGWASIDSMRRTRSFQPCLPREGPSTFGANAQQDASTTATTTINEKEDSLARVDSQSRWFSSRKQEKMPEKARPPVGLVDIVEGRTCRPIALVDLRSYLAERREQERLRSNAHDGFGDGLSGITTSQAARDLDAVNFVVTYDRCVRAYRSGQSSSERLHRIIAMYVGGNKAARRLDWMVDLGLLSEDAVRQAALEIEGSGHPSALLPLVNAVSAYLDSHVMPDFMEAASRNLSKGTSRGRLAAGIVATALAILLSVLLAVEPSPLTGTRISRWYRVLTFPLWAMGFGYVLAAWTGVCVWLSLRGNRERREEELATPRVSVDAARALDGAPAGATSAEAAQDEGNLAQVDQSNWIVAPEVRRLLPFLPKTLGRGPRAEAAVATAVPHTTQPQPAASPAASPAPPTTAPSRPLAEPRSSNVAAIEGTPSIAAINPPAPVLVSKQVSVLPGVQLGMRTVMPTSSSVPTSLSRLEAGRESSARPARTRLWHSVQRWTGFAVDTERVRDKKVRQIHQWRAAKAVALDGVLALVATIIVVAVP